MNRVRDLIYYLFFWNFCSYSIRLFRGSYKNKNIENNKNQIKVVKYNAKLSNNSKTVFDVVLTLIVYICLFALCLYFYIRKIAPFNYAFFVFALTIILSNILYAINASIKLKPVLFGSNDNSEFTIKETETLIIIISSSLFINFILPKKEILVTLESLQINPFLIDLFISILFLLYFYAFTFIIIVLLIQPIKDLRSVYSFIAKYAAPKLKAVSDSLKQFLVECTFQAKFSNYVCKLHNSFSGLKRYIILVLLLEAVFIDILFISFNSIVSFAIFTMLVSLEIFRVIAILFRRLVVFLSCIPGKRIMNKSFRLSVMISILLLVISNRVNWLHEYNETYIGISEFVASAIIIPLILEWISSYHRKNVTK